jgi:ribosome-binding protein aMBF1 (putative translation factor)
MDCRICGKEIERYNIEFNRLVIDRAIYADICEDCIKKFIDWRAKNLSKLFPTSAMKKRFG